jgi:hypothetical protein
MGAQSQTVHANEIKAQVGAASPDGRSSVSISEIKLDPAVGSVGAGPTGSERYQPDPRGRSVTR